MIMDERTEFADAVAASTTAVGTKNFGDVIDTGATNRDLGQGQDIVCVFNVDTTFTSTGSATCEFHLVSSSEATPNTTGVQTIHFRTAAIPVATLAAGYQIAQFVLPQGTYKRYVGVQMVSAVSEFTAGAASAFLTPDKKGWTAYPDASN